MNQNLLYTIQKKTQLSNQEKEDLQTLVRTCCLAENLQLSFPLEPDTVHYFLYENLGNSCRLASAVSVLPYDETLSECAAFTHPDCRKNGYFSVLLNQALDDFNESDLLFFLSNHGSSGLAVLTHLGAELQAVELQMERSLSEADALKQPSLFPGLSLKQQNASPDSGKKQFQLIQENGLILGSCQLSPAGCGCLCLHHVEIQTPFRKQGYGYAMLSLLFQHLAAKNVKRLILQVSKDNTPALALYKKTGFGITETLSTYLY